MVPSTPRSIRRAKRIDRLAGWIITGGGLTVIAAVVAIVLLIAGVTLPLFRSAGVERMVELDLPAGLAADDVLALVVEPSMDGAAAAAGLVCRDGRLRTVDLRTATVAAQPLGGAAGATLAAVERAGVARWTLLWSDGAAALVEIVLERRVRSGETARWNAVVRTLARLQTAPPPQRAVVRRGASGTVTLAALAAGGRLLIEQQTTSENLLGDSETKSRRFALQSPAIDGVTALTMDEDGRTLYVGQADGRLLSWRIDPERGPVDSKRVRAADAGRAITALAMVLGDVSVAVGDAGGGLSTWFPVRVEEPGARQSSVLRLVHRLAGHAGAVTQIAASGRNKTIASLGPDGVRLDYPTSERRLAALESADVRHLAFSRRGDAILTCDAARLNLWKVDAPHPEVSFGTLFGKVLYEGYSQPDWVWQTTGGEDFEPKFSLVPLIFGTLKATAYALLLAGPLALAGAIYTSQFASPRFRGVVKPVVEVMAAVPSVVLGFLAALWLAPILERSLLMLLVAAVVVPAVFLAFMAVWALLRRAGWARRVEQGYEFIAVAPVLLVGGLLAVWLGPATEAALFGGNFRLWLFERGQAFDQRNSIVVAFGLGFAVMPIIFSIAEDALSGVPRSLVAASLALGGSRWQTTWRVILPSAAGGIFAAMMIGLGRAVGETMIVLMATGNTPVLEPSPLNGMRTLAANIAVEISEAPVGGTLYRVLFLCAVLLFLLTFLLNTAAELVRQRLRKRYGRF